MLENDACRFQHGCIAQAGPPVRRSCLSAFRVCRYQATRGCPASRYRLGRCAGRKVGHHPESAKGAVRGAAPSASTYREESDGPRTRLDGRGRQLRASGVTRRRCCSRHLLPSDCLSRRVGPKAGVNAAYDRMPLNLAAAGGCSKFRHQGHAQIKRARRLAGPSVISNAVRVD
jgi:hypothetical protein